MLEWRPRLLAFVLLCSPPPVRPIRVPHYLSKPAAHTHEQARHICTTPLHLCLGTAHPVPSSNSNPPTFLSPPPSVPSFGCACTPVHFCVASSCRSGIVVQYVSLCAPLQNELTFAASDAQRCVGNRSGHRPSSGREGEWPGEGDCRVRGCLPGPPGA